MKEGLVITCISQRKFYAKILKHTSQEPYTGNPRYTRSHFTRFRYNAI
jgi:hypothetical protein